MTITYSNNSHGVTHVLFAVHKSAHSQKSLLSVLISPMDLPLWLAPCLLGLMEFSVQGLGGLGLTSQTLSKPEKSSPWG